MRVVYVLTTLAVGGTERQVLAIAAHMAARGHAVALLVLKRREPEQCATDLDVVHLDIEKNAASVIGGLRRSIKFVRGFRPDVIHSHNFHGNMLARLLRLFYRPAKLVSTIHNVYEGGRLRMLAYRISDRLADRTTAVSATVALRFVELKAVPKQKCVMVTNAIDMAEFVPDPKRRVAMRAVMGVGEEFVWVSVGRITAAKDLPNLLQAFGNVCQVRAETELWIAGDAPAGGETSWAAVAAPEGAMDRVRRLGLRNDIAALLDAADAFVLGSAWEGMPLAVGEAMAMQKPVVATDVGCVRELAGDCGVLATAKDPQALAQAMLAVMVLPAEQRNAMGRAARARIIEHFSMDAKTVEWESLYRSMLPSVTGGSESTVLP